MARHLLRRVCWISLLVALLCEFSFAANTTDLTGHAKGNIHSQVANATVPRQHARWAGDDDEKWPRQISNFFRAAHRRMWASFPKWQPAIPSNAALQASPEVNSPEEHAWLYTAPMTNASLEKDVGLVVAEPKGSFPAGALRTIPPGMGAVIAKLRLRSILFNIREELYKSVTPEDHVDVWVPQSSHDALKISLPGKYDPRMDPSGSSMIVPNVQNISAFLEDVHALPQPVVGFKSRDFLRIVNRDAKRTFFPQRLYPVVIRAYAGEESPHFSLQVGDKEANVQNGRFGYFIYSDRVDSTSVARSHILQHFVTKHRHLYDDLVCYLSPASLPHANAILNKAMHHWLKGGWSVNNNCHDFSLNAALLMCQDEAIRIPSMIQQSFINGVKNTLYKSTIQTIETLKARKARANGFVDGGGPHLHQ